MIVFSPAECAEIVSEFDATENKRNENAEAFYKGSVGVGDLPTTLKHVQRLTQAIQRDYPGAVFSNTYTREYRRSSILGLHTDRPGLDLTLSVCLEKKTAIAWPLCISKTAYPHAQWDTNTDHTPYKESFTAYDMAEGVGAMCEGRKYPHWREPFECGEGERAVFVFYHWTLPGKERRAPVFQTEHPRIRVYEDFLSEGECAVLMWMAHDKLQRCTVVDNVNGGSYVDPDRTSSGTCFGVAENPLVQKIESRLQELTGYPVENGEGFQILRYEVGQEYRPHSDYFDPNSPGVADQLANNRVCTVLLYLNTPEQGGATIFPDAGISIAARRGTVLVFEYPTPTSDTKTLHAGAPVTKGVKWVATKWLRKNRY